MDESDQVKSRNEGGEWKIPPLPARWIMKHDFHVGGMSALDIRGHPHHLRLGGNPAIFLYGLDVPGWLVKLTTDASASDARLTRPPSLTLQYAQITYKP